MVKENFLVKSMPSMCLMKLLKEDYDLTGFTRYKIRIREVCEYMYYMLPCLTSVLLGSTSIIYL